MSKITRELEKRSEQDISPAALFPILLALWTLLLFTARNQCITVLVFMVVVLIGLVYGTLWFVRSVWPVPATWYARQNLAHERVKLYARLDVTVIETGQPVVLRAGRLEGLQGVKYEGNYYIQFTIQDHESYGGCQARARADRFVEFLLENEEARKESQHLSARTAAAKRPARQHNDADDNIGNGDDGCDFGNGDDGSGGSDD